MFLESFAQDEICYEARKLWKLPKISPVIMDQMQEMDKTDTKKIHPKRSSARRNYGAFNCTEKRKNDQMQRDIFGDEEIRSCQFCSSIVRPGATYPHIGNVRTFVTYSSDKRQTENTRTCYKCRRNARYRGGCPGPPKRRNSLRKDKRRQPNQPYFDSNNNNNYYKTVWGYEADYSEEEEDEKSKMIPPDGDANCPVGYNQYTIEKCVCRMPVVTSQPVVISAQLDRPKYLISESQGRIQRVSSNVQWTGKNKNDIMSYPPPQHQHRILPENGASLSARFFGSALSIASTSLAYSFCWRCFGSDESEESDYSSESGSDTEAEDTEKRGSDEYNHINDSDGSQVSEVEDSSGGSDNSGSDLDIDDSMSLYEEEIIVHETQTFGELGISSDDGFGADGGGNAFDTNSLSESEEYFGDSDDYDAYYYKKDKQDCDSVGFRSLNSNDNI